MIQCVDYEDILFSYAKIFILHGEFGKGYIISPRDINMIKEIHLYHPPLKTWFEDGSIKLYSMYGQELKEISKYTRWDVITEWCENGAYIDFWNN